MDIELYTKTADNIRELHRRYHNSRSSFYIFESLKKVKSPPHAGKRKVRENVDIINAFKHFFLMSEEANRTYFFIELAKYFDPDHRALSFDNVLNEIEQNLGKFTKENFLKYRESIGTPVLPVIADGYKPISKKDLDSIRRQLRVIQPITQRLWSYRSQWIAHFDMKRIQWPISGHEIERVFNSVERILNKLSLRVDWSTSLYGHVKKDAEDDTKRVVRYLVQNKKQRMRELERDFEAKKRRFQRLMNKPN